MNTVRQLSLVMLTLTLTAGVATAQVNHGGPAGAPGPVYGSPVYRGNSPFPAQPNPPAGNYNNGPSYGGGNYGNGNYGNGNYGNGNYGNGNYGNGNYGNGSYGSGHYGSYPSPSYPSPSYPSYPSYPTQNLGPCSINTNYNGGQSVYTVYDAYGNVMITTPDYNQAYQVALNTVANRACSYVTSNGGSNNGGFPNQQNYCQVMPGQNAYGQQFYRVVDHAGRIILNTSSYAEAQREVQSNPDCYSPN